MNPFNVLFSASTRGAYVPGINVSDIPEDVIEIPQAYWISLLQQLAVSPKVIGVNNGNGFPILVDPPPPSPEETADIDASGVRRNWPRPMAWWRVIAMSWRTAAAPR